MTLLDPKASFAEFHAKVVTAISKQFPVVGKVNTAELESTELQPQLDLQDIKGQKNAKLNGETWGEALYGTVAIKNNENGQVIARRKVRMALIPHMTDRYSYIVGGREYQVDSQWQLRPGAYARRRNTGELEVQFNSQHGKAFDVTFDPENKTFRMEWNKAKMPLYPFLKAMGVRDAELEKTWGKDTLAANKKMRGLDGTLDRAYKSDKMSPPATHQEAVDHVRTVLGSSQMDPWVTKITLGHAHDHVSGDALHSATQRLLRVQAGGKEDDRDALPFKQLRTIGDYVADRITATSKSVRDKILRQVDNSKNVRDAVKFSFFQEPLEQGFKKNQAVRAPTQINPLEMVSGALQTTVMGIGGIKSEHGIVEGTKAINPSHFGVIDPINTPEGCYDSETEVFTWAGWKRWPEITERDSFACRVNERLEFHRAEELQQYDFCGDLLGVDKPWLKFLVTPNHRVLYAPYWAKKAVYQITKASDMHGRTARFTMTHKASVGVEGDLFRLPPVSGNGSSVMVDSVPMEDWAELLGWFLSEGGATYDEKHSEYHVKIHQSREANQDNCERILSLLNRLPWSWSEMPREGGRSVFCLSTKQLAAYFSQFGTQEKRFIPEELLRASTKVRQVLLDTLLLGDGRLTVEHVNQRQNSVYYCTSSPRLADDVLRLATTLGYACSCNTYPDKRKDSYLPIHEVCLLRDTSRVAHKKDYVRVPYSGKVYCATVPGGLLYVRRCGGHPIWSGNSRSGVTLRMPLSVTIKDGDPHIPLYNVKDGKTSLHPAAVVLSSNVALPDQYTWADGKPTPVGGRVRYLGDGNEFREGDPSKIDYIMRHPHQAFNLTSNLIPFLHSTQGNRAGMAARHMEQAVSLAEREVPRTVVATGATSGPATFEELAGHYSSHRSPVAGSVKDVGPDHITVSDEEGKAHKVGLYHYFPVADLKSMLHSTSLVKAGDKVAKGQVVADTNYSKDGSLALGKHMLVAWMPYKGLNFEDGIVLSETAAKKLASQHLEKHEFRVVEGMDMSPRKFGAVHPGTFKIKQLDKLGDDGVVKVGQRVSPGDPLIVASTPFEPKAKVGLGQARRVIKGVRNDKSLRWDSDFDGEVVSVDKVGEKIHVHVKTIEPLQVGDKLSSRFAAKGIVSRILPDHEMPRTRAGVPMELLLNPAGIPSRINPGQIFEAVTNRIAEKTGKPYAVYNFQPGVDQLKTIQDQAAKLGISETEELFDPATGHSLGHVTSGPLYTMKLVHQVEKKGSVRSGMSLPGKNVEPYNENLQPGRGGHVGGQSIGALGMYALLAHGSKAFIREAQTWRAEGLEPETWRPGNDLNWQSQHRAVWEAIQMGTPLPTPTVPYVFRKFESILKGTGVNLEKIGNRFILTPLTDKHILSMSSGALPKPNMVVTYKEDADGNPTPYKGGLFDEDLTGGHGGKKFSHIRLAEPLPNPIFEKPIKVLTGLKPQDFLDVVHGRKAVTYDGKVTDDTNKGMVGGRGIAQLLRKIDVKKDLVEAKSQLEKAPASRADNLLKKVKYLSALDKLGMKPEEAYILHNLPVIPPIMRPAAFSSNGMINSADVNTLYKKFGGINEKLGDPTLQQNLTPAMRVLTREAFYSGAKAVMGLGKKTDKEKGLLQQISGSAAKEGFFQKVLGNKRQDLSMKSTITPEPSLGLDQIGIPEHFAMDLFAPFVAREIVLRGGARYPMEAHKHIQDRSPVAKRALEAVMKDRPVFAKRDPVLHKYGIQGFQPILTEGRSIKIHPLVISGFNADFDGNCVTGDTMVTVLFAGDTELQDMPVSKLPRLGSGTLDRNGARIYALPDGMRILSYDIFSGLGGLHPATQVTVERKARTVLVRTTSKVVRVTDNESLCVYNHDDQVVCRVSPLQAKGMLVPVVCGRPIQGKKSWEDWARGALIVSGRWSKYAGCFSYTPPSPKLATFFKQVVLQEEMDGWTGAKTMRANLMRLSGVLDHLKHTKLTGRYLYTDVPPLAKVVLGQLLSSLSLTPRWRGDRLRLLRSELAPLVPELAMVREDRYGRMVRWATKVEVPSDRVPVPRHILELGAVAGGPLRGHRVLVRTCSKVAEAPYPAMTRKLALRILSILRKAGCAVEEWAKIVESTKVRWERVRSWEAASRADVYDVVVPSTRVFAISSGLVVWDTMSVFVPISREAVDEARRAMPSNNLFSDASGRAMYLPSMEALTGLYRLSKVDGDSGKKAKNLAEVVRMAHAGLVEPTHLVQVDKIKTTASRVLLASVLPEAMHTKVLEDHGFLLHKKGLESLLTDVAKNYKGTYGEVANRLKDLGNGAATGLVPILRPEYRSEQDLDPKKKMYLRFGAHTLTLKDFEADKEVRDPILHAAQLQVDQIQSNRKLSVAQKEYQTVTTWIGADKKINDEHNLKASAAPPSNLRVMLDAGSKPSQAQYKQLVLSPGLVQDSFGRIVPFPMKKSFPEGQTLGDYWAGMYGVRRGLVRKVQEVQKPGVLTKRLQNVAMDTLIVDHDCGTHSGISMSADDQMVHGRYLAKDFSEGKLHVTAGTMLTPNVLDQIRGSKKGAAVVVRSPLRCQHDKGLCQVCYGLSPSGELPRMGANIGVSAAHALGERTTQLMLKSFHEGGTLGKANVGNQFDTVSNLFDLPDKWPHQAQLSHKSGVVDKIVQEDTGVRVWVGGEPHFVGKDLTGEPLHLPLPEHLRRPGSDVWHGMHVGMHVAAGQPLSDPNRTQVNPKDLYEATGSLDLLQKHLTNRIGGMFDDEGVDRRHTEVLVKRMTEVSKVVSPGGQPDLLRGEIRNATWIKNRNAELRAKGKSPILHTPVIRGVNTLPLVMREDWMAKMQHQQLRNTVLDAVATGAVSDLHGMHPVPAWVYGAEFGLTSAVAGIPGMEKYKGIPPHHY